MRFVGPFSARGVSRGFGEGSLEFATRKAHHAQKGPRTFGVSGNPVRMRYSFCSMVRRVTTASAGFIKDSQGDCWFPSPNVCSVP